MMKYFMLLMSLCLCAQLCASDSSASSDAPLFRQEDLARELAELSGKYQALINRHIALAQQAYASLKEIEGQQKQQLALLNALRQNVNASCGRDVSLLTAQVTKEDEKHLALVVKWCGKREEKKFHRDAAWALCEQFNKQTREISRAQLQIIASSIP